MKAASAKASATSARARQVGGDEEAGEASFMLGRACA
jgi:hypothetical protein